jgi:acetyltransferase-like isoleucine patch superfamily enzyme
LNLKPLRMQSQRINSSFISPLARIGNNVFISHGVIIYDNVEIGDDSFIGPYCVIGEPVLDYYKERDSHEFRTTKIGRNAIIRSFTTIYEDVTIGANFQTGHHTVIREKSTIGNNTSFGSYSELPGRSTIGNFVRIHSKVMLSENNVIEDFVWIFPFVVLTNVKHPPIGGFQKTTIKEYAQIFSHAVILPGITIGRNSLIGAGSVVTKDVADERLIIGNPGRDVKSVRDIKDDAGECVYPWKDYLTENRGYPWQQPD